MLLWSTIIVGGSIAYMVLNNTPNTPKEEEVIKPKEEESNYDRTYKYFSELTLQQQYDYCNYNLDLQSIADTLVDNRYFNAKKVARYSEMLGKPFTNEYKKY